MDNVVSTKWLSEHLNDSNLVILDASQANNKTKLSPQNPSLKIKGALGFSLKTFSDLSSPFPNTIPSPNHFEKEARQLGIHQDSIIVVYDNLGIYTSPRVWWLFKAMGHQNVAVLNGGLDAWIHEELPTESIELNNSRKAGNFSAHFNPDIVRNFKEVKANLDHQNELVIDARSHDRFYSLVPEPRKGLRSGTIPHSLNLPYTKVLKNGYFADLKTIKKIFSSLQLPSDKPMVFSCGSGITACILYLAYQQIAATTPLAIYDGSWTEWGQKF
ncbi:MAG: sulfurtransferase [Flavobacteriales bacterium]|jgi:thiosulfate/3-mercaptopyruvate sulfurtransferase|nr:sulfurtransferase [Flavobacteriales bacterium]